MPGFLTSNYEKFTDGTYGYTFRIDVSNLNVRKLTYVLCRNDNTEEFEEITLASLKDIMNYPTNADCPDAAYCFTSDLLYIFFKESAFPFLTTEFYFLGYRNPVTIRTLNDNIDLSPADLELFIYLTLKKAYAMANKSMPIPMSDNLTYLLRQQEL